MGKYPRSFWIANAIELFERAAFYGVFISLTIYLTDAVGFSDIWAGIIGAIFSAGIYFFPMFTGAYADKIGFKKALIIAFSSLTIGYFTLAALPQKVPVVIALLLFLMIGGSFIKSVITGVAAQSSTEGDRAKAYSIFYAIVNIGAFLGKTVAKPIRTGIDLGFLGHFELGVRYIGFYSAAMTFAALLLVIFVFRNVAVNGTPKEVKDIIAGFKKLLTNARLVALILIVAGFWVIQHQMYASMPKYIIRTVGPQAAPEWYANVNPLVVAVFVMFITKLMKNKPAVVSMIVGMAIMPFSALLMASGKFVQTMAGDGVSIMGLFSMHPIALMMAIGIAFQGIAECFISPRYLEFFSLQAPKGEEGMYLGFAHLHSFVANFIGFFISGFLLDAYCPNPHKPEFAGFSPERMSALYSDAHYIWYIFAGIGALSAVSLFVYNKVVNYIDRKKEAEK